MDIRIRLHDEQKLFEMIQLITNSNHDLTLNGLGNYNYLIFHSKIDVCEICTTFCIVEMNLSSSTMKKSKLDYDFSKLNCVCVCVCVN